MKETKVKDGWPLLAKWLLLPVTHKQPEFEPQNGLLERRDENSLQLYLHLQTAKLRLGDE